MPMTNVGVGQQAALHNADSIAHTATEDGGGLDMAGSRRREKRTVTISNMGMLRVSWTADPSMVGKTASSRYAPRSTMPAGPPCVAALGLSPRTLLRSVWIAQVESGRSDSWSESSACAGPSPSAPLDARRAGTREGFGPPSRWRTPCLFVVLKCADALALAGAS